MPNKKLHAIATVHALILAGAIGASSAVAGGVHSTTVIVPHGAGIGGANDPGSNYDTAGTRAAAAAVVDAQHDLTRIVAELRRNFEQSAEIHDARAMLAKTTVDYRDASSAALAPLRDDREYRQVSERVLQLEQKIRWGKFDDHMSDAQLAHTAESLLDARLARSAMEAKALASDAAVSTARFAMMDANGKLIALQREFERSIPSNPEFSSARDRLDAARERLARLH